VKYTGVSRADSPVVRDAHEAACTIVYEPLSRTVDGL